MALDELVASATAKMREMYEREHHHMPMLMGLVDGEIKFMAVIDPHLLDQDEKPRLVGFMRDSLRKEGCNGYAFICESWMASVSGGRLTDLPPSKDPNRIDILMLYAVDRERRMVLAWEVDERTHRVLDEVIRHDSATGGRVTGMFATLLEPSTVP